MPDGQRNILRMQQIEELEESDSYCQNFICKEWEADRLIQVSELDGKFHKSTV